MKLYRKITKEKPVLAMCIRQKDLIFNCQKGMIKCDMYKKQSCKHGVSSSHRDYQ